MNPGAGRGSSHELMRDILQRCVSGRLKKFCLHIIQ